MEKITSFRPEGNESIPNGLHRIRSGGDHIALQYGLWMIE
jgi:hypothetical protein